MLHTINTIYNFASNHTFPNIGSIPFVRVFKQGATTTTTTSLGLVNGRAEWNTPTLMLSEFYAVVPN